MAKWAVIQSAILANMLIRNPIQKLRDVSAANVDLQLPALLCLAPEYETIIRKGTNLTAADSKVIRLSSGPYVQLKTVKRDSTFLKIPVFESMLEKGPRIKLGKFYLDTLKKN